MTKFAVPATDVQVAHARQVQRRRHGAQVDHFQLRTELARQHTDRRATADEVEQHLPGDFLRERRHPFGDHAVITGKNRDPDLLQRRFDLPLQAGQLHRHRFQATEGAGRLGQLLLPRRRLFDDLGIRPVCTGSATRFES